MKYKRRTWHLILCSDNCCCSYQFSQHHSYISYMSGSENLHLNLRSNFLACYFLGNLSTVFLSWLAMVGEYTWILYFVVQSLTAWRATKRELVRWCVSYLFWNVRIFLGNNFTETNLACYYLYVFSLVPMGSSDFVNANYRNCKQTEKDSILTYTC